MTKTSLTVFETRCTYDFHHNFDPVPTVENFNLFQLSFHNSNTACRGTN